jgi:hypothetical protein
MFETVLGLGRKTVVRWETGRVVPSKAADQLLRAVRERPALFYDAAAQANIPIAVPVETVAPAAAPQMFISFANIAVNFLDANAAFTPGPNTTNTQYWNLLPHAAGAAIPRAPPTARDDTLSGPPIPRYRSSTCHRRSHVRSHSNCTRTNRRPRDARDRHSTHAL